VPNGKAALGWTVTPESHKEITNGRPNTGLCVIVRGKAVVNVGNGNKGASKSRGPVTAL
jgi:hypothetical protein